MVDQVGGTLGHAAPTAARTEPTSLARERDEPVWPAVPAAKARKASGQPSAAEEVAKLPLDKPRHAVSITQSGSLGKERLEA